MDELDKALEKYYKHFNQQYLIYMPCTMTGDEIIEHINRCIETNTKQEKRKYEDGADY